MQRFSKINYQVQKPFMKYPFMLIYSLVVIALLNSCKKESVKTAFPKILTAASLIGKWELRQMVAQVGAMDYPADNGSILEFTNSTYSTTDRTYKIFVQGNHPKEGYYEIVPDTSVNANTGLLFSSEQFGNRIILNNDTASDKIFFQIDDNKLIIVSGYFPLDGGVEMTYERQ